MSIGVIVELRLSKSYFLNSALMTKRNDSTPRPTAYAMKHGGMCPVKGGLLTKKVREAWFHDSDAADQAEPLEDSGNDWTVIDFGAAPNTKTLRC
jgi:hypothetical protein